MYSQSQTDSAAATTRVTPPSTASPLKHPRDTTSPERQELSHDGITSFTTADPPVTDLLAPLPSSSYHPHERRTSSASAPPQPTFHNRQPSRRGNNNTILNAIRELGYRKYLQTVNPPEVLPARLRAAPVTPEPTAVIVRTTPQKKKNKNKNKKKPALTKPRKAAKSARVNTPAPSKKRKLSEIEPNVVTRASPSKVQKSEDRAVVMTQEQPSKRAKTAPVTPAPARSATAKSKSRKTPKKSTTIGVNKLEKSRTKEQRWGDYLKHMVDGDKESYEKLPDLAIPPLGQLIDRVPVRPYTFNKGKVQDYGDGEGLHAREMELAREVGLSYKAYRQQKRMAFIGYVAMQLEGKKDFKKSHTQSMCNIDGNKATHLWVHFHDCWGWMVENPTPPVTMANLGDLQLPDLHVAQPQQ